MFLPGTYTVCTFDRYFTSHPLLCHLQDESLHGFGTIPKARKFLPPNKNDIWEQVKNFEKRGEYVTLYCENTGVVLGVHKSAKVTGVLSNYHSDNGQNSIGRWIRGPDVKLEKKEILTSQMIIDYNEGSYNMVDVSDHIKGLLKFGNKRSAKAFRPALEYCYLGCTPSNFWQVYRALHPESKITFRKLLRQVISLHFESEDIGPLLELIRKRISFRGSKRFTGKPIKNLKLSEIRLEIGPVKMDSKIFGENMERIYANTQLRRAENCMAYDPQPCYKDSNKRDAAGNVLRVRERKECALCSRRTHFRCLGGKCGVWACMELNFDGELCMKEVHTRREEAWTRFRRDIS